jgi:predicted porin
MDTIYKEYGDLMQMFGISSGNFVSASNMLSMIGIGRDNLARFHERARNSIQFETPQIAGFTAGFQYAPDEDRGENKFNFSSTGLPTIEFKQVAPPGADRSLYSTGVKFDSKRFYASVHHEIHNDFFGGSNNVTSSLSNATATTAGPHSRDTASRFSGEWRFTENQRFVVDIARLRYRESGQSATGNKFEAYNHNTWAIGWDGGFGGPLRLAVQYIRGTEGNCSITNGLACSTRGAYGYQVNGGVRWRWDRQTFIYAIGSKLVNGPSARYDNWAAGNPERGADILQFATGVSYTF